MCQRRLARCLASAALVAALLIGACSTPRPGPASAPTEGEAAVEGRAVFVCEQGVVVLERGARRVLFPLPRGANAKDPVWSPDGASVAFAYAPPRPGSTPATVPEPPTQAFASDLMAVGADGSGARVLVAHDRPGAILDGPAWGPDGRTLYFGYYAPLYQGDSLAGAAPPGGV